MLPQGPSPLWRHMVCSSWWVMTDLRVNGMVTDVLYYGVILFLYKLNLKYLCVSNIPLMTCVWPVLVSPAHRWSDNRTPPAGPARTSPPAEGWRAWLCDGLWWSRRRQKRPTPSTSAPERSRSGPPGPGARCTPDPPSDAAASTTAHWNLPAIRHKDFM